MDKMLYVAMTGARNAMLAQGVNAHNLANANTTGFRADLLAYSSAPIAGPGFPSRINSVAQSGGWNFEQGPVVNTGRALDVAVAGRGFIAVQGPDGGEVYTRAGDLRLAPGGVLTNGAGQTVLGDGGPIAVPPFEQILIGTDGSVSIVPLGQTANTLATVDRIRLVDPNPKTLVKGNDGLIRTRDGSEPDAAAEVRVNSGVLEGSNVNAIESLVSMLELARYYEMQVKLMETADNTAAAAARLLQLS